MAKTRIYLSLGSNIGDREANLRAAIDSLGEEGVQVSRMSSMYETEPVDLRDQPWFLNCVVEGETQWPAEELLRALRQIEARMGSTKPVPKGPRLLDLDILLYGEATIDSPELQVPHPRMLRRRFVLEPLAEIAPQLRHPLWKATVRELLAALEDPSEVRKFCDFS